MRYALLIAILLNSVPADAGGAEQRQRASQLFAVVVPSTIEAEQSGRQIRFRSSVPVLIQASHATSNRVMWTRAVPVDQPHTVIIEVDDETATLLLTIVPLY
jgi:hypothetical protein